MMMNVNFKKSVSILAVLFVALAAMAVVFTAENGDAYTIIDQDNISDSGFKQDKTGTLTVPFKSDDIGTYVVKAIEDGNDLDSVTVEVTEEGDYTATLSFKLSKGDHELSVKIFKDGAVVSSASYSINSGSNVWSNISTYIALIAIVIIIVVIAFLYMRANPRTKPSTTFTELEREKAEAKAAEAPAEKKETGRIRYTSSRRK